MSLGRIFRWPLVIGLLTLTGLVSGLVSDGWGDAMAALGLLAPTAVVAWFWLLRRGSVGRSAPGPQAAGEEPARTPT